MAKDDLRAVEHEIVAVTARLAMLKRRAAELKEQEQRARFDEVERRVRKLQASVDEYAANGGMRASTPRVLQYYVLNGKKYPVQRGRLFKALEQYRNNGGNLADLVQGELAADPAVTR